MGCNITLNRSAAINTNDQDDAAKEMMGIDGNTLHIATPKCHTMFAIRSCMKSTGTKTDARMSAAASERTNTSPPDRCLFFPMQ